MRAMRILAVLLAAAALLAGCADDTASDDAGLANPAAEHCIESGGTLELRDDGAGGEAGICIFPDGTECEEWAFYRDECAPGDQG
jgi:putative hemolysin